MTIQTILIARLDNTTSVDRNYDTNCIICMHSSPNPSQALLGDGGWDKNLNRCIHAISWSDASDREKVGDSFGGYRI